MYPSNDRHRFFERMFLSDMEFMTWRTAGGVVRPAVSPRKDFPESTAEGASAFQDDRERFPMSVKDAGG